MVTTTNTCCRRGYDPIPGQAAGNPRSPPHNQGLPYDNMRSPPAGNQPYGGMAGGQFNPPYQPPPMNQPGGIYQVCVMCTDSTEFS